MDIRTFLIRSYYKIDEIIEDGYRRLGNSCRNYRADEKQDKRILEINKKIGTLKQKETMLTVLLVGIGIILGIFVAFALAQATYTLILK